MTKLDILLAVVALFFPPVAVWMKRPFWSYQMGFVLALTLIGWIPGTIYAWYVIFWYPEPVQVEYRTLDPEGRVVDNGCSGCTTEDDRDCTDGMYTNVPDQCCKSCRERIARGYSNRERETRHHGHAHRERRDRGHSEYFGGPRC